MKLNLSYKDYKLKDSDYFNGNKTILTHEKAALAKVIQLYEDLKKKNTKYVDPDFGPAQENDTAGIAKAMYKEGCVPSPGYPEPDDVKWVSAD